MWNESLILVRLTQAKNFLERTQRAKNEVFNLGQIRIRFKCNHGEDGGENVEIVRVQASEKEDENSFGIKFLVGVLKCPNQVVAYAATKALVALSDFLRNTRKDLWPKFLLALWKDAQLWITSPEPSSLQKFQVYGKAFLQHEDLNQPDLHLKAHEDACLTATSNTLQTLQQSLKRCLTSSNVNSENKDLPRKCVESLEIFLCLLTTRVVKVATAIRLAKDDDTEEQGTGPCCVRFWKVLPTELVLGALLRLLCTGANILRLIFDPKVHNDISCGAYLDMSQVLIPIISRCALPLHKNCTGRRCISSYLRHKLLMFMIKLSEWFNSRPSLASSCYTALHRYGSDLLTFSLQLDNEEKMPTDETPFIQSSLDSSKMERPAVPCTRRLQRRALILLLKVAQAAHPSASTAADAGYTSEQGTVILPAKRNWEQLSPPCTCGIPSRVYLRDWMKKQYQPRLSGNSQVMAPNLKGICDWVNQLATALIQLYLEEDDLLLIMMTQLFDMPFLSNIFACPKHPAEDMFCRIVVEAFLPTRLFHAFLAAIHFDHSTLEKLLTSKTTGVLCLTYFTRSLRYISDSWPEFVYKSPCVDLKDQVLSPNHELNNSETKTPRVLCMLCSYEAMCTPTVVPYDEDVILKYMSRRSNGHERLCSTVASSVSVDATRQADYSHLFLFKVTECLGRLKLRIEDLHGQALFPYNPTPLLKRLSTVVDLLRSHSVP